MRARSGVVQARKSRTYRFFMEQKHTENQCVYTKIKHLGMRMEVTQRTWPGVRVLHTSEICVKYMVGVQRVSVMCSFVETNELVREQCSRINSFVQTSEQFAKYGQTNELIRELFANVREQFANFAGPKFP